MATGHHHQTVSYAKLLREFVLPQSSPNWSVTGNSIKLKNSIHLYPVISVYVCMYGYTVTLHVVSIDPYSDSFNYQSVVHNNQIVVAATTPSQWLLHSWDQFTGEVTDAWTISSSDHGKYVPYKMKYWQEYYLVKCIEKHFGKINIGNLDEML